ncbi:MAG: DMT family transporter [Proteobacteria bacterium]|nr:DMT family transporter [Pseudomonadota bacterium]
MTEVTCFNCPEQNAFIPACCFCSGSSCSFRGIWRAGHCKHESFGYGKPFLSNSLDCFYHLYSWFWLISNYAVSRLASFTFLTPIFGVIAGAVFLNEQITLYLICALVLVGTGIYLVNRR